MGPQVSAQSPLQTWSFGKRDKKIPDKANIEVSWSGPILHACNSYLTLYDATYIHMNIVSLSKKYINHNDLKENKNKTEESCIHLYHEWNKFSY